MQKLLSAEQVEAFHHDLFVEDQVRHFSELTRDLPDTGACVVDVGGGCGFFARRIAQLTGRTARVIDTDAASVKACRDAGIEATLGDALAPVIRDGDSIACFNLILHHLVSTSEPETRSLQMRALRAWARGGGRAVVFVNEYIYESYIDGLSGRLIFHITKSRLLSAVGRAIASVVPALRANTFGVGVRFRSHDEWTTLFRDAGFEVVRARLGEPERVAFARRALLIKAIRRDSFLLRPVQ